MTPTDPHPHHYSDAEMHNEAVAHEATDINIRALVSFAIGLAVVVIVSAVLMALLWRGFESQAAGRDPQISPIAAPAGQKPAGPQLLTDEPGNLRKIRAEEAQKLDSYGWVDEKGGVAHVPIEDAKKLLVQHGVPVRAGAVEDPREGTNAPAYGEASGGRGIPVPKAPAAPPAAGAPQAPTGEVKK